MKHLTLALALLALPAVAHEVTTDSLVIDHPYALETVATAMSGAGYMTITNTGSAPDRLLDVRADFPRVSLHGTETDAQGVTRMIPVEGIEIAPGETVTLAPGGMHVMFMGLDGDPFEEGERIPATLVFERAGEIEVEFWVEPREGGMTGMRGTITAVSHPVMIRSCSPKRRRPCETCWVPTRPLGPPRSQGTPRYCRGRSRARPAVLSCARRWAGGP